MLTARSHHTYIDLADFIDAHCERAPSAQVESSVLYHQYVVWAESNGEKAMTSTALGVRLTERGFTPCRIGKLRTRGWSGLRTVAARTVASAGRWVIEDESA